MRLGLAQDSCCCRNGLKPRNVERQMSKYSVDQLKHKLGEKRWQADLGKSGKPMQGTLGEMVEAAHSRRKHGYAVGTLEEVDTEIKVDMAQLEELGQHMGLPTI